MSHKRHVGTVVQTSHGCACPRVHRVSGALGHPWIKGWFAMNKGLFSQRGRHRTSSSPTSRASVIRRRSEFLNCGYRRARHQSISWGVSSARLFPTLFPVVERVRVRLVVTAISAQRWGSRSLDLHDQLTWCLEVLP
jgi:hypothetical protein